VGAIRQSSWDCPYQGDAFVLYSPDGEQWHLSELPGRGLDVPLSVAVGDTINVVGSTQAPHCGGVARETREKRGAIWMSGDGTSWTLQEFRHGTQIQAITPADSGYIALGWSANRRCQEPRSWTSGDGRRWTETELTMELQCVDFGGVVAVGDGFVAQVAHAVAQGSADPFLWSPNIEIQDTPEGSMDLFDGPGLVGVTWNQDEYSLWTSRDGMDWEPVPQMDEAYVSDVATTPGLLVAVGHARSDGMPAIWASTDGVSWERQRDAPVPPATGWNWEVAIRDDTIVALTEEGSVLVGTYHP
jgi:hypothetical protein